MELWIAAAAVGTLLASCALETIRLRKIEREHAEWLREYMKGLE